MQFQYCLKALKKDISGTDRPPDSNSKIDTLVSQGKTDGKLIEIDDYYMRQFTDLTTIDEYKNFLKETYGLTKVVVEPIT